MSSYAVICPLEGMEPMAQSQWVATLRRLGHRVAVHNLRSPDVDPRANLSQLVSAVTADRPEMLFVEGAIGFNLPEFYLRPEIREIPVAAFWFDDPLRTVECWKTNDGYLEALRLPNVHHFVWDGYWRKWLRDRHSIRSFPIHLAADPKEFYPKPQPKEYPDHCVFVGTLVSPAHLQAEKARLPPVARQIADELETAMKAARYATNPYEVLGGVVRGLSGKVARAFEAMEAKDPDALLHLRGMAWKMGKTEVRKRILREALRVAPLLILCGNYEQTHATEAEMRELLGAGTASLKIKDTRAIPASGIVDLYAYGRLHLQATDPQSIEGGIPFRVFQTTACRRPLLTDRKNELAECYTYGEEILTFDSEKDFAETLDRAMKDTGLLEQVAERGYRRFLEEHTWQHRFEYVKEAIGRAERGGRNAEGEGK